MKSDRLDLSQVQVEQLLVIGDTLRQARTEQGLSIEHIAKQTLIQRRVLDAIEAADLTTLPEPVYVQGFIKRYASALGLDGSQVAAAFPIAPMIQPIKPSWKELPAAQLRPFHLYAVYGLLVVGAVMGLAHYLDGRSSQVTVNPQDPPSPPTSVEAAPVAPAPAPVNPPAATLPTEAIAAAPETPNGAIRVDIKLTAQSWMRITVDGETQFEGILQEGEERSLTASENVTVRAGNAGGVLVALNGQGASQLGAPGSVEEVTFPPAPTTASVPAPAAAN